MYFNSTYTYNVTASLVKKCIFLFSYLSNKYLKKTKVDADLYVFLTDFSSQFGLAGVAWLGTLCGSKQSRISISAYLYNDIYTAEVRSFSGIIDILNCFILCASNYRQLPMKLDIT